MNEKAWFKPKSYGWGLAPISWQGWLVTLLSIALLLLAAYIDGLFDVTTLSSNGIIRFVLDFILLMGLFFVLAREKTVGEIKWNWGEKKNTGTNN